MFSQSPHATYFSADAIEAGTRRAHRARSAAFTGFFKKAFSRDFDVLKSIDAAI